MPPDPDPDSVPDPEQRSRREARGGITEQARGLAPPARGAFSFSRLKTYSQCPQRYRYRYLEGRREAFRSVESFLGKTTHAVLEWLYAEREQGRSPDSAATLERLARSWSESWTDDVAVVRLGDRADDSFRLARELLERFHREVFARDRSTTLALEQELTLRLSDQVVFTGFADRIGRTEGGRLFVVDYKTSRSEGNGSDFSEGLQAPLYAVCVLARMSHRVSSRGRRGAVLSGVFDPRGAEAYLTVRRAPRGEKTPLGAVHRRPQQEAGEKCGLVLRTVPRTGWSSRLGARGAVLFAAVLVVALIGAASPAWAAMFVVNSTADAGDAVPGDGVCDDGTGACTLRAAIRETNALGGADVIEVPAGTYVLSIAGKSEDAAATGDLDVRGDLTIIGAGSAVTVVDADAVDRVFECPLTGAPHDVEISGLTVQHGDATGSGLGYGGGIAVSSNSSSKKVTLTLDDVVLAANTAEYRGCGLWLQGTNHAVVRSSVVRDHDCPSVSGVGMDITGTVEIVDSTFRDNVGATGGGLRTFGCTGPSEIRGTSFLDNTALGGGAVYNQCDLTVRESLFDGNQAVVSGYSGGSGAAVDNTHTLRVYDSVFSGNSAEIVGGALSSGGSTSTYLEVARCLFTANTSVYYAAGAYLGGGQYMLRDSTFSGNDCGFDTYGDGCAIYTAAVPQVTIDNCTFSGNWSHIGGTTAIKVYNGTVTVGHSIFAGGIGGPSCGGTVTSAGYNIENGSSCGLVATGDQPSTDPLLGPLADNGGPSSTHMPLPGSPAIDGGDPTGACTATDQRGAPRPADGDNDGSAECDVGAVEVMPVADLAISKDDGQTSAIPGSSTVYAITVSNAGPDDVTGAVVSDPFDDPSFDRSLVSWTCAPDPGAGSGTTCPPSGTGDDLAAGVAVDVEAAASVTFTATAPIRPEATGTLANTAGVVSASSLDLNPDNDSATDEEPLTPAADLWIEKDDGLDYVLPGGSLTYLIEVGNDGPSDEPAATVTDAFPEDLDCTWTCVPAGDAACPAGPVIGDIADTVALPAGDSVTFTAVCAVSVAATGSIDNTASVAPSAGVSDPQPANDADSDTTAVRPLDFGDAGPSYPTLLAADGARHGIVSGLYLGAGVDAENDGLPTSGADGDDLDGTDDEDGVVFLPAVVGSMARAQVVASTAGQLDAWVDFDRDGDWADADEQIAVDLALSPGANDVAFPVPAGASLGETVSRFRFSSAGGLAPFGLAEDGEVEDHAVELVTGGDLRLHKTADRESVDPGDPLTYGLQVTNLGPFPVSGVTVVDDLPAEVLFVSVSPGPPICAESGGTVTCQAGTLDAGEEFAVEVEVTFLGATADLFANTASADANEPDPDPSNDNATITTAVGLIFRDGFESGHTSAWSLVAP